MIFKKILQLNAIKPYHKFINNKKLLTQFIQYQEYTNNANILTLNDRGFFQDIFPDNAAKKIAHLLTQNPQTIYAGFDPTADSLHVGNLLVIMGLLHCQRAGHQPIALIGGATGRIGDPSGRHTERTKMEETKLDLNIIKIQEQIRIIFENHEKYIWKKHQDNPNKTVENPLLNQQQLKSLRIVNNLEWYSGIGLIDFIGNMGRNFRMGTMLSRSFVQNRLQSDGISYTEFSYQIFQAYDWLHLYKAYKCKFQIGGSDQMGNIMSGQELISRVDGKQVYGLTIPIISDEEGDKFGKSGGNAIWLSAERTSPFSLYQFLIRSKDSEVENLLKLLTFLSIQCIDELMSAHRKLPELRDAQKRLAQEVTLLVHGEDGLERAEQLTAAIYNNSGGNIDALGNLDKNEVKNFLLGSSIYDILPKPGMTILDVALASKCFPTENDAIRIINAGGFYINQKRAQNISEIISPTVHILKNNLTILRVGKKNYTIINWI